MGSLGVWGVWGVWGGRRKVRDERESSITASEGRKEWNVQRACGS